LSTPAGVVLLSSNRCFIHTFSYGVTHSFADHTAHAGTNSFALAFADSFADHAAHAGTNSFTHAFADSFADSCTNSGIAC
jgi:hypothetical protein